MPISNEILQQIQCLQYVIEQVKQQHPEVNNQQQFNKLQLSFRHLKRKFLIQAFADYNKHTKDIIISENFLNRLIALIEQTRQCTHAIMVNDYNGELKHLINCCVFTIQKMTGKKTQELYCCETPMVQDTILGIANCLSCNNNISISKKLKRPDKNESRTKSATYAAMKHFDTCFKNIFIGQQEQIDQDIIDQIKQYMKRDRKNIVNIEDIRQYLKQITCPYGPKYNKLDAQILQKVNGEKQFILSNVEYIFIKDFYQHIITIFYEMNHRRNNTPNCAYFIKQIINLLYSDIDEVKKEKCMRLIFVQKEITIDKIKKIWQSACKPIDIALIKKDFTELLRQQKDKQRSNFKV